jgi:phosphotransferase system enzyme I (PtsP)
MAGRPIEAMALVGIGLRTLSMAPGGFGPVKSMVRALDLARFSDYLGQLMNGSQRSVRDSIRLFARDHGIPL